MEDLYEKITYLLSNESEIERIAAAGQKRTLNEHSTVCRSRQFSEILQSLF